MFCSEKKAPFLQPRDAQALEFRRPIRPAWTAASWARAARPKARKRDPPERFAMAATLWLCQNSY